MNAPLTSSMFMFFLVSLWIIACVSQASAASPKLVNLTGTLYSPGQNNSPGKEGEMGLSTFNVSIQSKEWILDLKRAQNLEGNELGPEILEHVFPSTLRFEGPQNLLVFLEKPELAGQLVTIRGYMHVPYNTFEVTAIGIGSGCFQISVYNEIQTICGAG